MLLPLQQNLPGAQVRLSWLEIEPADATVNVRLSWLEIEPADATVNVRLSWLEIEPGEATQPPADDGNDSRGLGIGGPHAGRERARRIQAMREAAVRARNQEIIQAIVAMVTSGALDDVTVE